MSQSSQIISKLDAAHRQIRIAIRMYFADDDLVAIHTLACAAREIYEKHCDKAGIKRSSIIFEKVTQIWKRRRYGTS